MPDLGPALLAVDGMQIGVDMIVFFGKKWIGLHD